jgi:hypothetical protein
MYSLKPWISCYHEVADNITSVATIHFSNIVCNILSCKTEPPEVMSSFEVSRPKCFIPCYTHYIANLIPLYWFITVRCIAPD